MRILLAEASAELGGAMVRRLEGMGHAIDWARDGFSADELLRANPYAAIVLDLALPEMDGARVLRRLRDRKNTTGVLIVSTRNAIEDRVGVLDLGADDYLVAPFDFREFEARVRSLLRRCTEQRGPLLSCADLSLDRAAQVVKVRDAPVSITRREMSLLEVLLANQNRVTSKPALLEQMFDHTAEPHQNAIEVLIARLRPKLAGSGAGIRTYRGLGYRMEPGGCGELRAAG